MSASPSSRTLSSWLIGRRLRPSLRVTAMAVAAALTVTLAAVEPAAGVEPTAVKPKVEKVESRPDMVSAQVTAKAQGSRVEVESLREEKSTTWVNPDGTLTTQQNGGQVRFKDSAGKWRDVDLTLEALPDGTVEPKGHPRGLSLAGAGKAARGAAKGASETDLAAISQGKGKRKQDRDVTLGWAGGLGAPVLSGTTATYKDVKPGVDLTVESRRTGYETHLVINTPQALAALTTAAKDGSVVWDIPVKTTGLTARSEKDGSVSFVDADGQVASVVPAPVAWDGAVDPQSGNRVNESPVAMTVTQKGAGKAVLTLTPDQAWLTSSDRVFPVTIDPTYATGANSTTTIDTYVSSAFPTTNYDSATELRVGTYNGGADKYRSFLAFNFAHFKNLDVKSASLSLYEFHSYSCTAKPFYVYAASAMTAGETWNGQPGVTDQYGALTTAKGYSSSCAAGRVSVPITGLVDAWASSAYANGQLRLSASETDSYGWKKFYSVESSQDPYITFTYNRKPNLAAQPTLPGAVMYHNDGNSTDYLYTKDARPTFSTVATDPDGNGYYSWIQVHNSQTVSGTSMVADCVTPHPPHTASGKAATCTLTTDLADNKIYHVRASSGDDQGLSNGGWSPWTTFRTARQTPTAPVISCPTNANGSWAATTPSTDVDCTITGAGASVSTSAPGYIKYAIDGSSTWIQKRIIPSVDPNIAKVTGIKIPKSEGAHSIKAQTLTTTLIPSAEVSYAFGYGSKWHLGSPSVSPMLTSTSTVGISASGPPKGTSPLPTASLRWRTAGGDPASTLWNVSTNATLTVAEDAAAPKAVTVKGSWNAAAETTDATLDSDPVASGIQPTTLNPRIPVRLDVQVCVDYPSLTQCTWEDAASSRAQVGRVPHAFGDGFPTADAGPGQVALFTGEFNTTVTDASVPGYTGDLSLSRSHSTYDAANPATVTASTGVFGPGWSAALDGSDAGLAGLQVIDSSWADGTVVFVDTDGTPLVFAATASAARRTGANLTAATWVPADEDTALSGIGLKVAGAGATTSLTLTEDDGTATVFKATTAPATGKPAVFAPDTVTEPGSLTTSYIRDTGGRVTRILAPIPPGVVRVAGQSTDCPDGTPANMAKGCRALRIVYADGTAVGGVTPRLVTQVNAELYNPTSLATKDCANAALTIPVGMASIPVACYAYDATNHLTSVKDPRTGLATSYTYGTANQLISLTPPGQTAITLGYATLDSRLKLTSVTRPQASPLTGTANLIRIAYDAPLVPAAGTAVPDLSEAAVGTWGQAKAPTYAAAVFGPEYTGTITQASGATKASASDWSYADLSYTTADGYTVNTASYGAGAWQRTSTDYDDNGNVTRELDAGAVAKVAADGLTPDQAALYSTKTVYNSDGTLVTDTYGPIRDSVLTDGGILPVRPHVAIVYDENAPTPLNPTSGQPWRLPTSITTRVADGGGGDLSSEPVISTTTTAYAAQVVGTGDGWILGSPTKVTSGGIAAITIYDAQGRVTQFRQPKSPSGADAGTTSTVYYTADGSASDIRCRNKGEWAGLVCLAGPAGVATSVGTAANGPNTLPTTNATGYGPWLGATVIIETSGAHTRTTTTTVDAAGRPTRNETTISGSSVARPAVFTHYDATNGLADYSGTADPSAGPVTKTTEYDAWGRPILTRSETTTAGTYDTTTTDYDTAGRVVTVTDPKGTTHTTWDGTDANSKAERRGMATKVTVTRAGSGGGAGTLDFTGAYDADGSLATQKLPGGITQRIEYDDAGVPSSLSYDGQVTPVTGEDGDGNLTYGPPTTGTWLAWTQAHDVVGRVRVEYTGEGAGFDSTSAGVDNVDEVAGIGRAYAYDRGYTYDGAGRLTKVTDRTATALADEMVLGPDEAPTTGAPCQVRTYGFDNNGNRISLTEDSHADGDCAGTAVTQTQNLTYAYDNADRPTTARAGSINGTSLTAGSYTYDAFGRQTIIPGADAPLGADIELGYYDDDLARTITQDSTTTTFALDSGGRRTMATTVTDGNASTLERRYTDGSDNPGWTISTVGGVAATTRYAESLSADLIATINQDGSASLSLATLLGDAVTTVPIAADASTVDPALGISGWADYTEYGGHRDAPASSDVAGAVGYGWLGGRQRSTTTETAGLTLMGDRLYNATTGRFSSTDPKPGGNDTAYSYPSDPIGMMDLDGHDQAQRMGGIGGGMGPAAGAAAKLGLRVAAKLTSAGLKALSKSVKGTVRIRKVGGKLTSGSVGRVGDQAAYTYLRQQGYKVVARQKRMFGGKRVYDLVTKKNGQTIYWEIKSNGGKLTQNQMKYDRMARNDGVVVRYMQVAVDRYSGNIVNIYW